MTVAVAGAVIVAAAVSTEYIVADEGLAEEKVAGVILAACGRDMSLVDRVCVPVKVGADSVRKYSASAENWQFLKDRESYAFTC